MIKKLLCLLVVAVFIFTMGGIVGSLLTPVYGTETTESTGITITVTLPEPITDDALLAEMAARWMIQARDSHQWMVDNWNVSTPWIILEDQQEWVRRYDIVIELLE